MAHQAELDKKPADPQDDQMAQKLMDELKDQGVDLNDLKDDGAGAEAQKPAKTAAPAVSAPPAEAKTPAAVPEAAASQTPVKSTEPVASASPAAKPAENISPAPSAPEASPPPLEPPVSAANVETVIENAEQDFNNDIKKVNYWTIRISKTWAVIILILLATVAGQFLVRYLAVHHLF